jgi:hypothetical protein
MNRPVNAAGTAPGSGQQHRAQGRDRCKKNDAEAAIGHEHQENQRGKRDQKTHRFHPPFWYFAQLSCVACSNIHRSG